MSSAIFDSLIEGFALERGKTGEYFGEINSHPVILTVLSANPPGVILKIRINSENKHDIELHESLSELKETGKINVSVENGYGWLTFYDLSEFATEKVVELLAEFIEILQEHSLGLGAGCTICKRSCHSEVYYSESKINRLCPECLKERERKLTEKNRQLLEVKASSIWLSLLGMIGFAAAWAMMWLLYDYMFIFFGRDEIQVSDYALVVGGLAAVTVLALMMGLPLRRFGIQNSVFLYVLTSILAVISFLLGEILLQAILVIKATGSFVIVASIRFYVLSWQEQLPGFQVVKILLVIGAIIGISLIAKKKKAVLEL